MRAEVGSKVEGALLIAADPKLSLIEIFYADLRVGRWSLAFGRWF